MKKITTLILSIVIICAMSLTAFADGISLSQAKKIALKQAGLSTSQVKGLEAERDDDNIEVEFIRRRDNAKHEYDISQGGKILEKSVEYPYKRVKSTQKVGKTAALKKVSGFSGIRYATVSNGTCTYKTDKGIGKYKIRFRKGNFQYEYELLSRNAQVIEYEWKYIRK